MRPLLPDRTLRRRCVTAVAVLFGCSSSVVQLSGARDAAVDSTAPDAPADAPPDAPADAPPGAPAYAPPDAPADAPPDAPADAPPDVPIGPSECRAAEDCAARSLPGTSRFCTGRVGWSCVVGRCTAECAASGRTCARDAAGCIACSDGARACPGAMCATPPLDAGRYEDGFCARAFSREVTACFGAFAVLRDGLVCTLEDLPTGAIRAIMACAGCQTTLTW